MPFTRGGAERERRLAADPRLAAEPRLIEELSVAELATLWGAAPPELAERHHAGVRAFIANGKEQVAIAGRRVLYGLRSNGERFAFEAAVSRQGEGAQMTMTAVIHDLTERLAADAARERLLARTWDAGLVASLLAAAGSDASKPEDLPSGVGLIEGMYQLTEVQAKEILEMRLHRLTGLEQETHCVLATTVARLGGTLHVDVRQGEPGAQLSLSPLPADTKGPVYFGENVIPDMALTATTKDGGALYYHVAPGEYQLSATKEGFTVAPVKMKCRAGYLVNAGPPIGVQTSVRSPDWGAGADLADDAYTVSPLTDDAGNVIRLTPGRTFVELAKPATFQTVS